MSERIDWLKEYERYLDGEIEYQDLPPRPALPTSVVMTTDDVETLVSDAYAASQREGLRLTAFSMVPIVGVSIVLALLSAPWWAFLGAQWVTGLSFIPVYYWYENKRGSRSPKRRDPTRDDTSKDLE